MPPDLFARKPSTPRWRDDGRSSGSWVDDGEGGDADPRADVRVVDAADGVTDDEATSDAVTSVARHVAEPARHTRTLDSENVAPS